MERIRHVRAMGCVPVVNGDNVTAGRFQKKFIPGQLPVQSLVYSKSEAAENNNFIENIPFAELRTFDNKELMVRLMDIDRRLRKYCETHPTYKTKSHHGISLGYTAVTGGYYAKACWGDHTGSYHANQNFLDDPELLWDAIEVCCLVITTTYKNCGWYIKLMEYYNLPENQHKKPFLLPGTPCTNIWWSINSRGENKHVDWNAYGASFLFCPNNYQGGAIVLESNKMKSIRCKHLMKLGQVLAGRWSRSHHYNETVGTDESRSSFVMYGDTRILEKTTYLHVETKNTSLLQGM
jgi:hypothetical protein